MRGAGPRVLVGLFIWCGTLGSIHYFLEASSHSVDKASTSVSRVAAAAPAPLPDTPALTLVSDAQAAPAPPLPPSVPTQSQVPSPVPSDTIYMAPNGTYLNNYDWGQCTWYVAGRRQVPANWGNADTWYGRAEADGWTVGLEPVVGAIAWTAAGSYGHVALVDKVLSGGTSVEVSEMNYIGIDIPDNRTVPAADFQYIYQ